MNIKEKIAYKILAFNLKLRAVKERLIEEDNKSKEFNKQMFNNIKGAVKKKCLREKK